MKIPSNAIVKLGPHMITQAELLEDAVKWEKVAHLPEISPEQYDNLALLHVFLYRYTPFAIETDSPVLMMSADIVRFPYTHRTVSRTGETLRVTSGFCAFSLRLAVTTGRITAVELHNSMFMAVNSLRYTSTGLFADLGNGALYFELLHQPPAVFTALQPPRSYKPEVVLTEDLLDCL